MIDRSAPLSLARKARVLGISRGSIYYTPRPVTDADLAVTHRIDQLHREFPFAGSRMLQGCWSRKVSLWGAFMSPR